mmetsp:Transcript_118776/g.378824  ORF Transcript_118776/g.378824 Transcript_118776/m.378824 type:complete len:213 (-) Transcript_118776:3777-4415(-)
MLACTCSRWKKRAARRCCRPLPAAQIHYPYRSVQDHLMVASWEMMDGSTTSPTSMVAETRGMRARARMATRMLSQRSLRPWSHALWCCLPRGCAPALAALCPWYCRLSHRSQASRGSLHRRCRAKASGRVVCSCCSTGPLHSAGCDRCSPSCMWTGAERACRSMSARRSRTQLAGWLRSFAAASICLPRSSSDSPKRMAARCWPVTRSSHPA